MKLIFSEDKPDYENYSFPYAVWALPEENETPSTIFNQGFLPSSKELDRFYLCRQIRVDLAEFEQSSENRRILRKGEHLRYKLIPKADFEYSDQWRNFCKEYTDKRFGQDVMPFDRLDSLFNSKITTHLMIFTDPELNQDVGLVTLYLEENKLAFYYYSFYDLKSPVKNLGMFMMTQSVDYFARKKFKHIYLGSCYSRNALYKTQFKGFQFFNGFRWSTDLKELKFLLQRDQSERKHHLVENPEFIMQFYENTIENVYKESNFKICLRSE